MREEIITFESDNNKEKMFPIRPSFLGNYGNYRIRESKNILS